MLKTVFPILVGLVATMLAACGNAQGAPDPRALDVALRDDGLAGAESVLRGREQTPETAFLLGSVHFLSAFEHMLQVRYASNSGPVELLPGMRTRLPANPEGTFDPAFLEIALTGALDRLARAEAALGPALGGEFAAEVQLRDLWLDINGNGTREDWEGLVEIFTRTGITPAPEAEFDGVIRFDTADAEWLAAYVHLVSGVSETVLALEPTPVIRSLYEGRQKLETFGELSRDPLMGSEETVDQIAAALLMLDGVPDRARTRAALAHFRAMIARNRVFWAEIAEETDNDREWLPNPRQVSVFGVEVSEDMAAGWQDVLAELDQVFAGELLVPYWRVEGQRGAETGVGLNIARLFEEPGNMDLVLWIQGTAAAAYLEEGQLTRLDSMERFMAMTRGNGWRMAAWFN